VLSVRSVFICFALAGAVLTTVTCSDRLELARGQASLSLVPQAAVPQAPAPPPTAPPVSRDKAISRRDVSSGQKITNRRLTKISKNNDQHGMFKGNI